MEQQIKATTAPRLPLAPSRIHILKSPKRWDQILFGSAAVKRLRCISYCSSPELLLDFFHDHDIESMEFLHGNHQVDYREALVDHPDVADQLEHLKETGRLVIWAAKNKTLHTKAYEVEHEDGTMRLLVGSPNLTHSAVKNQVNMVTEYELTKDSTHYEDWERIYDEHKNLCFRFLDDLTDLIERSDEERIEVITRWVEGRSTQAPPDLEASAKIVKELHEKTNPYREGANGTSAIEVSMVGFDDSTREFLQNAYGGRIVDDKYRLEPQQFSSSIIERYYVPHVALNWDKGVLLFYMPDGSIEKVGEDPPPDDPEAISSALAHLESFVETIDKFAVTDYSVHVKAHMMEALLYFLWAPFASWTASLYRKIGIENTKNLPFLYITGEPNAGKDTLARFGYRLISPSSWYPKLVDGGQLNTTYIRSLRYASTIFPAALSDVKKQKIENTDILRNYWEERPNGIDSPTIIMTSNENRPGEWFRERAKILNFDCRYTGGVKGNQIVNQIVDEPNPLYEWIVHEYTRSNITVNDDPLYRVREILLDLYTAAGRPVPEYFPRQPAEHEFSLDQLNVHQQEKDGFFKVVRRDSNIVLQFKDADPWDVARVQQRLPQDCRAIKRGKEIIVKNPPAFEEWLPKQNGHIWGKLTNLLRIR